MKLKTAFIAVCLPAIVLCLGITNSRAAIIVTVQDVGPDMVISYDGFWDVFTMYGSGTGNVGIVGNVGFIAYNGPYDSLNAPLTLDSGSWTSSTTSGGTASGDPFAFTNVTIIAPSGYTAGDPINGSLTFAGTNLSAMGFTVGDSGTFSGGGNTVNFTVVPEPATFAALAGILALGFVACRRRVRK